MQPPEKGQKVPKSTESAKDGTNKNVVGPIQAIRLGRLTGGQRNCRDK